MIQTWPHTTIHPNEIQKNKKTLNQIINGKFSALVIKNFYDVESCKIIIKRANKKFENKEKFQKKIGVSLVSYANRKSEYFLQAENARRDMHEIFYELEDPRKKIHLLLSKFFPNREITNAFENDKKYACGVIRLHGFGDSGAIHRDNVSFEARNFDVSKHSIQLSTVLYIQQSEKGGELILYKKQWKKDDEKFRNIEFGYSRDVITNSRQYVKIKPRQGDLIIINPNFYHEILPVKGNKNRITLGLFLAFSDNDQRVVTWS